jgi:hypothetical protein
MLYWYQEVQLHDAHDACLNKHYLFLEYSVSVHNAYFIHICIYYKDCMYTLCLRCTKHTFFVDTKHHKFIYTIQNTLCLHSESFKPLPALPLAGTQHSIPGQTVR